MELYFGSHLSFFLICFSFIPEYLVQTTQSTNYIAQFMYTSPVLDPEYLKSRSYF